MLRHLRTRYRKCCVAHDCRPHRGVSSAEQVQNDSTLKSAVDALIAESRRDFLLVENEVLQGWLECISSSHPQFEKSKSKEMVSQTVKEL